MLDCSRPIQCDQCGQVCDLSHVHATVLHVDFGIVVYGFCDDACATAAREWLDSSERRLQGFAHVTVEPDA